LNVSSTGIGKMNIVSVLDDDSIREIINNQPWKSKIHFTPFKVYVIIHNELHLYACREIHEFYDD